MPPDILLLSSNHIALQPHKGYMGEMEADSRRVLPNGSYEIPDHITVENVPLWKRAAWGVVGFLLQPFRMLI